MAGDEGKVFRYLSPTPTVPLAQTNLPTHITNGSAVFNGSINPNSSNTSVWFQYGSDPGLGLETDAIPDQLSGSDWQEVMKQIFLSPGSYYYRVVAENDNGINYGQINRVNIGANPIPNWSFEYWDTLAVNRPISWLSGYNVDSTSSYNGSVAVEITSFLQEDGDTEASFIVKGSIENEVFTPTVAFPFRPDTLAGHFKYEIEPNDTAFVVLRLSLNSNTVAFNWFPITGSSSGVYEHLKFPVDYSTADTPDSLWIGIVNSNFAAGAMLNSVLALDNLHFPEINYTIENGDFEDWHTLTKYLPTSWQTPDHPSRHDVNASIEQSQDTVAGNFALKVINDPLYETKNRTFIHLGEISETDYGPHFPVNYKHEQFNGYFKYFPQNNDTLQLNIEMFFEGQQIGQGYMIVDTLVSEYELFQIPIDYFFGIGNEVPDSANIRIALFGDTITGGGSIGYFDNLGFDGFYSEHPLPTLGIENLAQTESYQIKVYPNPTSDQLTVEVVGSKGSESLELRLVSLLGSPIWNEKMQIGEGLNRNIYSMKNIMTGVYFLTVSGPKSHQVETIIVSK